jgi:hypothetical protein
MTKREQVRTVKPYRTGWKKFEWEPYDRFQQSMLRHRFGNLTDDIQRRLKDPQYIVFNNGNTMKLK